MHIHIVVSPGNWRFYCLSCGNTLSAKEATNTLLGDSYGALPQVQALEQEKLDKAQCYQQKPMHLWNEQKKSTGNVFVHVIDTMDSTKN